MNDIGLVQALFGITILVVFFVMAYNIAQIKKILENQTSKENTSQDEKEYECQHCDYVSEENFDFCPKCKKNDEGLTLEQTTKK